MCVIFEVIRQNRVGLIARSLKTVKEYKETKILEDFKANNQICGDIQLYVEAEQRELVSK